MIPQNIEKQIRKAAGWYARELPLAQPDNLPPTPEWLSREAEG